MKLTRHRQVLIEVNRKSVTTDCSVGTRQRYGPIVPVFGLIGEALEHGKWVNVGAVPTVGEPIYSVIRLEPFDESTVRWIELVSRSSGVGPLLRGNTDRELDTGGIRGQAIVRGKDEFPCHLVEGGPIVTGNVEYFVDDVIGEVGEVRNLRDLEDVIAALGIAIGPKACVVFRTGEGFRDVGLKRCQMIVTPPEFGHRRGQ